MKFTKLMMVAAMLALLVVPMSMTARPAVAQGESFEKAYLCFPTCSEIDARFVSIAGADLTTLTEVVAFKIIAAGGTTSFEIGFFDGDSGGTWDFGVNVPLEFTLFADPDGDGTGTFVVNPFPLSGSAMTDNAWYTVNVNNVTEAESASGDFVYHLKVSLPDPSKKVLNDFKVRTDAMLLVPPHTFAYIAPLYSVDELFIIYPEFNGSSDLSTTTYDGTWYWYLDVPEGVNYLTIWDGDFDRGSYDETDLDTDDPDTPNVFTPDFAGPTARSEGIATVQPEDGCSSEESSTACPADDRSNLFFVREPAIQYTVIAPDGQTFANTNPSGNKEWEQFRIDTAPFDRNVMDYHADSLPAGTYIIRTDGVDLSNLNAWYFEYDVRGVPSASIGDRVWYDINGNSIQDAGEPGLNGVVVSLYRDNGDGVCDTDTDTPLGSQITSGDGDYDFLGLGAGNYCVGVDESTLPAGFSWTITTFNNPYTPSGPYPLAESDDHDDADFGYDLVGGSSDLILGDFVWLDLNGDGIQNDGFESGIGGVMLRLEGDPDDPNIPNFTLTTGTIWGGQYVFTDLLPGQYTVIVEDSNFDCPDGPLCGLTPTASFQGNEWEDSDGSPATTTLPRPVVDLNDPRQNPDEDRNIDFGYIGTAIGDYVWNDANVDGIQNDGDQAGINGVVVELVGENNNMLATTTTMNGGPYGLPGWYEFRVTPGTYTVRIADSNFGPGGALEGFAPTLSLVGDDRAVDSNGSPTSTSVGLDETDDTLDFGYYLVTNPGTGTPGYWKNHPEAWPVDGITIGGEFYDRGWDSKKDKLTAVWWMNQADKLDKTITMFRSLVAAKLNVMIGNDSSCIAETIAAADEWMAAHGPVGSGVEAGGDDSPWRTGEPLYLKLDAYNNGLLCAPSRD